MAPNPQNDACWGGERQQTPLELLSTQERKAREAQHPVVRLRLGLERQVLGFLAPWPGGPGATALVSLLMTSHQLFLMVREQQASCLTS